MPRPSLRLALAGALSVCLSAGATLVAQRALPPSPPASQEPQQILQLPTTRPVVTPGGAAALQQLTPVTGGRVAVIVELLEEPGAVAFAAALERAPLRDASARASAAAAGRQQLSAVAAEQQRVGARLASAPFNGTEIYRVQRAMNAIAVTVDSAAINALRGLPGVKAVRPIELEYPQNSSSVPFLGVPAVWDNSLGLGLSATGAGIRIGVIDTGVDYQHPTFGGAGVIGDYQANDRTAAPDAYYPTAKVVGGWDFVGDAYNGSNAPTPDADPMDCNGHGTHVAGTAAGYGVTTSGTTFTGPFGTATPFSSLRIGPGTAPQAQVYALRVFGCGGGTGLTVQAIDWAMDPNGDLDLSDRLDVINMSLGSNFGGLTNSSAIAADNASRAGVIVVTSAGNSGDTYFISGSPGSASRVIATAATQDNGLQGGGLTVNAPAGIAGTYVAGVPLAFGQPAPPGGVTGSVVIADDPSDAAGALTTDGCSTLTNPVAIVGRVALIDRGNCDFFVKVKNAQDAGAIAAIIANSAAGTFGNMGGTDATVTIPSVMVTYADGNALKANIATLNVTLFSAADTIASFSSRGPRGGTTRTTLKPDLAAPGYQIVSAQTGVTCTGSGGSTGCQTSNGSGYIADGAALTLNGTSMAAPHVAGIMALLRQLHPTWTVEELKALIMNHALHDVTVLPSAAPRVGPGRIGAGRVDATLAAQSSVVAFNADDPGLVSLSFDGDVSGTITRDRKLRIVNHGTTAQTYDLAVDTVVDAPGVSFAPTGGSTVTVPAGQSVELTVRMSADASQMDRSRDETVTATQAAPSTPAGIAGLGSLTRQWLAEEAGYLVLSQAGSTRLRVPLYTAPAPVADMSAPDVITTGGAPTGTAPIALTGTGVCTGTPGPGTCTGAFGTDVVSVVTPFELQVSSPIDPVNVPALAADIQYVGVAHASGQDLMLFGISTWGSWKTPNDVAFNVKIDCGVYTQGADFNADTCTGGPDGTYDLTLFNSNPGSLSRLFGTTANPQDTFMTAVFVHARNAIVFGPVEYLNGVSGAVADTRVFDNQAMILSAPRTRLKISGPFNYAVNSCPGTSPLCEALNGFAWDRAAGPYFWNHLAQGLDFAGIYHAFDLPGSSPSVTWNTPNIATNGSLGALLLHLHNAENKRAEVVLLDSAVGTDLAVTLTASTTTPAVGEQVTLTLGVENSGPNAATGVAVQLELPPGFSYVSDNGGGAYNDATGKWTVPGTLNVAETRSLQIVVSADTAALVSARATVYATAPLDPIPGNNVATLGIMTPPLSDLRITVTEAPVPTIVGTTTTVTVDVTNIGVDAAYNLVIANSITGFGSIQGGAPTMGLYDPVTGNWTIAGLQPGASASLTLTVFAASGPSLTVQASVSSITADAALANNTDSASLLIDPRVTALTASIAPGTSPVDETRTVVVTLTDIAGLGVSGNPTGTVTLSSPQADVALTGACVLTPTPATTNESTCSATVAGSLAGLKSIAGSYTGNALHAGANGSAGLTVETRASTTTAANATAVAHDDDQPVLLTATVTSSLTVNAGTVTFTVRDASNAVIGAPVSSAALTDGTATATYTLPGGTAAQTLHIEAAFADGTRFAASLDDAKTLTVSDAPVTTRVYTLAEGATGTFFDTRILLANPNATEAPITVAFAKEGGGAVTIDRTLAPMSRGTIAVDEVPGVEAGAFSTTVTSTLGLPLVVERTMSWDATGYGAHAEKAEEGAATDWYFAEGAHGSDYFTTFLLLANPNPAPQMVEVNFFREDGVQYRRGYMVPANSRYTIDSRVEFGQMPMAFGMHVHFPLGPGFAERSTYFGRDLIWTGGHASAGTKTLSTSWLFAEGATGSYFSTFLMLANPSDAPTTATVTFLPAGGTPVVKTYPLTAWKRLTLNVGEQDPTLAVGAVGARVEALQPIVAERAQYWPQPDWIEGHSSLGVTAAERRWGLAEGTVGGAQQSQTYIQLLNPGDAPATVTATFLRATGAPIVKTFTVAAHDRRNIWVGGPGTDVPELADEGFGTLLESTEPIVAERSVYGNVGGVVWATGTNATATALPLPR